MIYLSIFSFTVTILGGWGFNLINLFPFQDYEDILLCIFLQKTDLFHLPMPFIFKSMKYMELILTSSEVGGGQCSPHPVSNLRNIILLKTSSFPPQYCSGSFIINQVSIYMWICFWSLLCSGQSVYPWANITPSWLLQLYNKFWFLGSVNPIGLFSHFNFLLFIFKGITLP